MKPMPNVSEMRLQKSVQIGTLLATYGGLLTEKQQTALRLHYEEDLSLGEIADQMGASRQNVHELITRSAQKLQRYEETLGTVAKFDALATELTALQTLLESATTAEEIAMGQPSLSKAKSALATLIQLQEGEAIDHGI